MLTKCIKSRWFDSVRLGFRGMKGLYTKRGKGWGRIDIWEPKRSGIVSKKNFVGVFEAVGKKIKNKIYFKFPNLENTSDKFLKENNWETPYFKWF